MSLGPPDLVVDSVDPFKEDKLARKAQVESLCELVTSDKEPVVVSVDGKFGSGKSTFLSMCAAHLRQHDVSVVELATDADEPNPNPERTPQT